MSIVLVPGGETVREELVAVKVDHPLGSTDEDNPSVVYPINVGYQ